MSVEQTIENGRAAGVVSVSPGSALFSVGQEVRWIYTPRGGWCIPYRVKAHVVKINRTRIRIAVKQGDGSTLLVNVKPENLRPLPNNSVTNSHTEKQ